MTIQWKETTQETFDEMLGVLPPASMVGNAFLVGEPVDHRNGKPTFDAFKQEGGKCFVSDEAITFDEFKGEFPNAEYDYYG